MVEEVDRRETADAVKHICLRFTDTAESYLRQGEGVRGP
jgi:hypothetical protein